MFDLYIKNAKTATEEPIEIGITNGKIVAIEKKLQVKDAKKTIDLNHQSYLSAGWIDGHTHCYEEMNLYYDSPDTIGYTKGVTSVIDAGSTGADNIAEFYSLASQAKTNVFALVNISKTGIVHQNELADLTNIQEKKVSEVIKNYPDFIVGIKARMSKTVIGDNGIRPLELAKLIQEKNQAIPLMVHVGSAPPDLKTILSIMDKGDVLTHCYNGKLNGILNETGQIHDFVWDAYQKGIRFDIGHGTDSFNFAVAEQAKREKLICHIVSTDIYHRNREDGPVYNFSTVIEKMLFLGYALSDIIPMVTTNPAKAFQLKSKGTLEIGYDADITIFDVENKEKTLVDSNGNTRKTTQVITPIYTIIGGNDYRVGVEEDGLLQEI
ncbi:MAG: amidohydrolase/deacetylase family metallohydrolase [Carnobacterium sp.]|uniref:amidohydrolase/deacetylase family metallohydrolase n=1 Tax=Carnobacterium sp. TaxID=48221 RepID=UPI003314DAAC